MKNVKKILVVGLALGLVSGGTALAIQHGKEMKVAKADELETYIPMESTFFTNWTDDAGAFKNVGATFWGENYSFEALDTFYSGESKEGWTGTLTSKTWKQSTQYIYFQLGAAKDYGGEGDHVHLKFHYGTYEYDFYNNTFVENPMVLRSFKIPDEQFSALKALGDDFDMSLDIVDPRTSDYGFANFGYLHVNQTLESCGNAMRYFLNHLSTDSREWEVNKRKEIQNSYFNNSSLKEVFYAVSSDISDSFSTNTDFVNHWYFDHNYFNNEYGTERHFDVAISTNEFRPDNPTNMPFNNDGGFFRGWYESAEGHTSGFVAADNLRYRFVSRPFVISETGIVSIKMSGKASLHIIDATVLNNDTQQADLAWIDNEIHMDGDATNMALSSFNTTAMVNHVINLEAYLGKTVQLAICDRDTSGWSAAYFDELVVNYASRPAYHVDTCVQTNTSGTFYPSYFDIYINSSLISEGNPKGIIYNASNSVNTANENAILNHVDSSDSLNAYNVWKSYIDNVRGGKEGRNYCSDLTSDGVKAVLNAYNSLSASAKQIVCASDDFERVGTGDWWNINPTIYDDAHVYNLAHSLQYLAEENEIAVTIYSGSNIIHKAMLQPDQTAFLVIVIVTVIFVSLAALQFVLKKKKEHR